MKFEDIAVEGIPVSGKYKALGVLLGTALMLVNHNIVALSSSLDYPHRDVVTVALLASTVIFSVGNYFTESVVIALSTFAILSNTWDMSLMNVSQMHRDVMLWSFLILAFSLTFGKVGFVRLYRIVKNQIGV